MGELWAFDAITLNFLGELDFTDSWVLERLDFQCEVIKTIQILSFW